MAETDTHSEVKSYYGKRVKSADELNLCYLSRDIMSHEAMETMKLLHPNITSKWYGCGAVFPECVEGCTILDLGSGAGVDCFVLSKMVGPTGHVTGVDMTPEQVETSVSYIPYHMQQFGYTQPNVDFRQGYIERLDQVGLKDNTFDIIVSNCVINLTPDKEAVLREAYRVLKPGGELYFSDMYADRPVPESFKKNPVLWGEGLAGSLHWKALMKIATEVGFAPPVLVKSVILTYTGTDIEKLTGGIKYCSATYRLFKTVSPVEHPSDTLTEVSYKGTVKGHEKSIPFTYNGTILSSCPVVMPVSTAHLLQESRFSLHFNLQPVAEGREVRTVFPALKEFLNINPFEVNCGSFAPATPDCM